MQSTVLADGPLRQTLLVFDRGDEVVELLTRYAENSGTMAASFRGIGAFSDATLGYFDWSTKHYHEIPVEEQVEVTSLLGDIALDGHASKVHAHVVLGRSSGAAITGHLLQAHVRPTLEVVLEEAPTVLRKRHDRDTGLALIDVPTVV
jgi:predicted DNA-binding protein with PD1-like motif